MTGLSVLRHAYGLMGQPERLTAEEGNETGEIKLGYTEGFISLNKNYDFEENPFEVYAISKDNINAN